MEANRLLKRKRKALDDGNQTVLANVCTNLGELHSSKGNFAEAIEEYETAANVYKQLNKAMDYGRANRMISETYLQMRDYDKALRHQKIFLDIAKEQRNKIEEQRAHATFGHIYLTRYLDNVDNNPDKNCLHLARKAFDKSLHICDKCLTTVSKTERMDMTSRIHANLGILYECYGEYDKGIELLVKSINTCKQYDLFEQLERSHTCLAAVYGRKNDYGNAITQYNLAIETAKRLENKIPLMCSSLSAKADIYLKMANYTAAKDVLLKAHKLKSPNKAERDHIERNLKIVVSMCCAHDDLMSTPPDYHEERKKLFEKLGDGACELKNYPKAIEYYLKMLEAALKNNETGRELSVCYVSLAQTYKDNKEYDLAIEYFQKDFDVCKDDFKESVKTLYNIADVMDLAGKSDEDVEAVYEQARNMCVRENDLHLTGKTLKHHINFLKSRTRYEKAIELEKELFKYEYTESDDDSEEELTNTTSVGDDVRLQEIIDTSDESDVEKETTRSRTSRRRNKGLVLRRNHKGETQLHTACINGNVELVRRLIEQGHIVNVRDNCGWLPLHEACIHGHLEIARLLLDKGAAINDRGGIHCQGVSPLHDAATNGHLEIIQLLLDRGASPLAKTDDGETPLQFLKKWRAKCELDPNQNELYEKLVSRMTDALLASASNEEMVANEGRSTAFVNADKENALKSIDDESKSEKLKTSLKHLPIRKQIIGTLHSNTKGDLDSKNDHHNKTNKVSTDATEEYRRVMESIKRPTCEVYEKKRKSCEFDLQRPEQRALIENEDYGDDDDDWLVDDLGVGCNKKRKSSCADKLMTTSNTRRTSNVSDEGKLQQKKTSKHPSIKSTSDEQEKFLDCVIEPEILVDDAENVNVINMNNGAANKQKIQKKLTSFLRTTSRSSLDEMIWDDFEIDENHSSTVNNQQTTTSNSIFSIDVRIENRLFKIPVSYVETQTKTIKWLAEEAANRYFKKECVKPTLELESKNGAVLGDDDLLCVLFPQSTLQSEEVRAKVLKWDLPSLAERYKEICSNCNEVPDSKLYQVLQEVTTTLDLSNSNLCFNKLLPICKALNRQNSLYHLNISGNRMTRDCMLLLCSSLTSLENLSTLNMSLNHLNAEHLKNLSDAFLNSHRPILENLSSLNLSYNPLGDDSLKHLAVVTRHLRLHTLLLSSVDFTGDLFENFSNKNIELYLEHLETLDVSRNNLNAQAILRFVSCLKSSKVLHLDVSCNAVKEQGLLKTLVRCLSNNNDYSMNLKHINFSRCCIGDSDVHELLSFLSNGTNALECLNLSYNDDLTALTLRRLIQHYPSIKRLELHGCENILKYFDDCTENVWTFTDVSKINFLSLSLDHQRNKRACDILMGAWKKKYPNECVIIKSRNFLLLKLKSAID